MVMMIWNEFLERAKKSRKEKKVHNKIITEKKCLTRRHMIINVNEKSGLHTYN